MKAKEIQLSSGTQLRVRRVPDYALIKVGSDVPLPPEPMEVVQTATGEERVPARPGSPAYQEYQLQFQRAVEQQERRRLGFVVAYGVVAWNTGDGWECDVPDGWELDPLLEPYSTGFHRGDYILFEVLTEATDISEAIVAIRGQVTEEEVSSAEQFFRHPVSGG